MTTLTTIETKTQNRVKILTRLRLALIISVATSVGLTAILSFVASQLSEPIIKCSFDQYGPNGSIPCAGSDNLLNEQKNVSISSQGYYKTALELQQKNSLLAYNTNLFFNAENQNKGAFEFWFKPTQDPLETGEVEHFLYEYNTESKDLLQLAYSAGRVFLYLEQDNQINRSIIIFPKKLHKNEWYHLAVDWKKHNELENGQPVNDEINLFINGEYFVAPFLIGGKKIAFPDLTANPDRNVPFRFGSKPNTNKTIIGLISNFQVYNYPKKDFIAENPDYPNDGFFTYVRPTFGGLDKFNFILPTTKPKPEEITNSASIFASRDEYEPATFAIYSHNQDLNNVKITADDFKDSSGNTISKDNLDIRVVKVWPQAGFGPLPNSFDKEESWTKPNDSQKSNYRAQFVLVPELLVYNDSQNLQGSFTPACQNNLSTSDPNSCVYSYFEPPSLDQNFNIDIPQYQSKQIWLTAYVPKDAQPGQYSSTIHIKPSLNSEKTFNLNLTVLNNDLAKPKQDYGIWFKNNLGPGKIKNQNNRNIATLISTVKSDLYEQYLIDIKKHGFQTISTDDFPTDGTRQRQIESVPNLVNLISQLNLQFNASTNFRQEAIKLFRNNNFENNIVQICTTIGLRGTACKGVELEIQLAKDHSYEPLFYTIDEPSTNGERALTVIYSYNLHDQNAEAVAAGTYLDLNRIDNINDPIIYNYTNQYTAPNPYNPETQKVLYDEYQDNQNSIPIFRESTALPEKPQHLDLRIYGINTEQFQNYANQIIDNPSSKDPNKTEYIYWQLMHQFQKYNRFIAGYYLWNIKMNGIFPYAYQSPGTDPYNDFDYFISGRNLYRDQMATYPSKQGPIPTLEWENLREGYDDVRYLTTLEQKLTKLNNINPGLADSIETEVNNNLEKYNNLDAWENLSDADFQETRALIANKIIDINNILNPKDEPDPRPLPPAPISEPEYPEEKLEAETTNFFNDPNITYRGQNRIILSWQADKKLDQDKYSFNYGLNQNVKKTSQVYFNDQNNRYYVVLEKLKGGKFSEKNNKNFQNGRAKYYYQVNYDNQKTDLNKFKTLNRFQTILYYYSLIFSKKYDLAKYEKPDQNLDNGGPYFYYRPENEKPNSLPGIKFAILNDKKFQEYDQKIESIKYKKGQEEAVKADYQIILDRIYPNNLDKKYDQDGVNYWLDQLNRKDDQKIDFDGLKFMLSISPEYRQELFGQKSGPEVFANLAYQIVLKRSGDKQGIKYLKENYSQFKDMRQALAQSAEYEQRINEIEAVQGREASVSELYETLFARAPDLAGVRYYTQSDLSLAEIKNEFLNSSEFVDIQ